METVAVSAEPGDMECPICHEEYTVPKILPCAHILCRDCLVAWLTSDMEALCPLCRRTIADIDERIHKSPEIITDALPTDLSMVAVVKCSSRLKESHMCCACPNVTAVGLCLNCDDMLCHTCVSGHGKLRATRHHKVEDLASLTAEKLAARGTSMCTVHADESCKLFCTTHCASICQVCATTKHRACPEVIELDEKARAAHIVLDQLLVLLQRGKADIDQTFSHLDQQLHQIDEIEAESIQEIDKLYNSIKSCLEAHCHEMRETIRTGGCDARKQVNNEKATISAQHGTLTAHERLVVRVKESIPYSDLDDMTSMLQARVKDLDFTASKWGLCMKTFHADSQVLLRIKDDIRKVGQLNDISDHTPSQKRIPKLQSQPQKQHMLIPVSSLQALAAPTRQVPNYNIQHAPSLARYPIQHSMPSQFVTQANFLGPQQQIQTSASTQFSPQIMVTGFDVLGIPSSAATPTFHAPLLNVPASAHQRVFSPSLTPVTKAAKVYQQGKPSASEMHVPAVTTMSSYANKSPVCYQYSGPSSDRQPESKLSSATKSPVCYQYRSPSGDRQTGSTLVIQSKPETPVQTATMSCAQRTPQYQIQETVLGESPFKSDPDEALMCLETVCVRDVGLPQRFQGKTKIKYDRQFLLSLRSSTAATSCPKCLLNQTDVILDEKAERLLSQGPPASLQIAKQSRRRSRDKRHRQPPKASDFATGHPLS